MRVFLDVGAHIGQTLAAAKRWNFDRIVCFEPATQHLPALEALADERTSIRSFGLLDRTVDLPLYNVGGQGASLWKRPERSKASEMCSFVRASDWLNDQVPGCEVWMKLNVEGAELDILTDLMDTGAIRRINYLLVMWDARKIPEIAPRMEEVRARLATYTRPIVTDSRDIPDAKTREERIDGWLATTPAKKL